MKYLLLALSSILCTVYGQSSGDVRLIGVDGQPTTGRSGRLEVYFSNRWGTVCADGFDERDAQVACRQLGFDNYAFEGGTKGRLTVIDSNTPIWLDDVSCTGSESELLDCSFSLIISSNCDHSTDVGLICASNGHLRFADSSGGSLDSFGRLEVLHNRVWGTVCTDRFSDTDARVACSQMGYSDFTRYGNVGDLGFSQASLSTRTWLDEVRCLGTESRLVDCPANPFGVEDCSRSQDVGLVCTTSGDLRLVDNSGQIGLGVSAGRLEVYYNGTWGTVCENSFSPNDARIACRELGFSTYTRYGRVETLGYNSASSGTPIWLGDLRCSGLESQLIDCPSNPLGDTDCSRSMDIALICREATTSAPATARPTSGSSTGTSTGVGVAVAILFVIGIGVLFFICSVTKRRRYIARSRVNRAPVVANVRSTTVVIATGNSNAQVRSSEKSAYPGNPQQTAYPMTQQPPQNVYGQQPYPTGGYAAPNAYPPQQQHNPYPPQQQPMGYPPQQQPTAYPAGGQVPPAPYPSSGAPPTAYPASGTQPTFTKDAPPAYPGYAS